MEWLLFSLMKRDAKYTGIGGYLNNSNRTLNSDFMLLAACEELKLTYAQLFLWVNSRYARHFMDGSEFHTFAAFVEELRNAVPALEEETK